LLLIITRHKPAFALFSRRLCHWYHFDLCAKRSNPFLDHLAFPTMTELRQCGNYQRVTRPQPTTINKRGTLYATRFWHVNEHLVTVPRVRDGCAQVV